MPIFYVLVPDDLADRFAAYAAAHGGRSAAVRKLISDVAERPCAPVVPLLPPGRSRRLTVGLADVDLAILSAAAAERGLSPNAWVSALVRRRLTDRPCFNREGERDLAAIQVHLRRICTTLAYIAREAPGGGLPVSERQALERLRHDLREQLAGLRAALAGNLEDWRVDW
jgi:hypothetical protein